MKNLAADLQGVYKENFDVSNLYKFKQFYEMYSDILDTASLKSFEKLTWSHYRVLLQVKDDKARSWYEKEAAEQTSVIGFYHPELEDELSKSHYTTLIKANNDVLNTRIWGSFEEYVNLFVLGIAENTAEDIETVEDIIERLANWR